MMVLPAYVLTFGISAVCMVGNASTVKPLQVHYIYIVCVSMQEVMLGTYHNGN